MPGSIPAGTAPELYVSLQLGVARFANKCTAAWNFFYGCDPEKTFFAAYPGGGLPVFVPASISSAILIRELQLAA